ncbi:LOW QUALITY PROTEIN: serine/threonine/tyrosine-interacting-like protein 2 [Lethenteron reissneri]|uniref:LOW QUALITY PROTEIN: serine/threonine/tyrosine-interacting-like protein 2 n=1 Tax=Lethenteron reissneri TaxID=7753 RepID=UPI002AB72C7B|nr:LOW QUALITY PROTEIN: serine/threonine/tyrosine-interacting-like protein 2 [Lethenteron reissneri]
MGTLDTLNILAAPQCSISRDYTDLGERKVRLTESGGPGRSECAEQLLVEDLYRRVQDKSDKSGRYGTPSVMEIQRVLSGGRMETPKNAADLVWDGIYIGDVSVAMNRARLKRMAVTHVVNAAHGTGVFTGHEFYRGMELAYLAVPADDFPDFDISGHFYPAAAFIDEALLTHKGTVLVTCVMGYSRAAALVAAYLMIYHHLPLLEALTRIRLKRPVSPNEGFLRQLRELNEKLLSERDVEPAPTAREGRRRNDNATTRNGDGGSSSSRSSSGGSSGGSSVVNVRERATRRLLEEKVDVRRQWTSREDDASSVASSVASCTEERRRSWAGSLHARMEVCDTDSDGASTVLLRSSSLLSGSSSRRRRLWSESTRDDEPEPAGSVVSRASSRFSGSRAFESEHIEVSGQVRKSPLTAPSDGDGHASGRESEHAGDDGTDGRRPRPADSDDEVDQIIQEWRRRNETLGQGESRSRAGLSGEDEESRRGGGERGGRTPARSAGRRDSLVSEGSGGSSWTGASTDVSLDLMEGGVPRWRADDDEDTESNFSFYGGREEVLGGLTPVQRWRLKKRELDDRNRAFDKAFPPRQVPRRAGRDGADAEQPPAPPDPPPPDPGLPDLAAYQRWKLGRQRKLRTDMSDDIVALTCEPPAAAAKVLKKPGAAERLQEALERSRGILAGIEREDADKEEAARLPPQQQQQQPQQQPQQYPAYADNDDTSSVFSTQSSVRSAATATSRCSYLSRDSYGSGGHTGSETASLGGQQAWSSRSESNASRFPCGGGGGGTSKPLFTLFQDEVDLGRLERSERRMRSEVLGMMSGYAEERIAACNKRSTIFKKKHGTGRKEEGSGDDARQREGGEEEEGGEGDGETTASLLESVQRLTRRAQRLKKSFRQTGEAGGEGSEECSEALPGSWRGRPRMGGGDGVVREERELTSVVSQVEAEEVEVSRSRRPHGGGGSAVDAEEEAAEAASPNGAEFDEADEEVIRVWRRRRDAMRREATSRSIFHSSRPAP